MESGKQRGEQDEDKQVETDSRSGGNTQMIAAGRVITALAVGYLIYKVTTSKHCCPPSSPTDGDKQQTTIDQRRQQGQVEVPQPFSTPHKPLSPLI